MCIERVPVLNDVVITCSISNLFCMFLRNKVYFKIFLFLYSITVVTFLYLKTFKKKTELQFLLRISLTRNIVPKYHAFLTLYVHILTSYKSRALYIYSVTIYLYIITTYILLTFYYSLVSQCSLT